MTDNQFEQGMHLRNHSAVALSTDFSILTGGNLSPRDLRHFSATTSLRYDLVRIVRKCEMYSILELPCLMAHSHRKKSDSLPVRPVTAGH